MTRSHRRTSRQLLAALAVILVLGFLFSLYKMHEHRPKAVAAHAGGAVAIAKEGTGASAPGYQGESAPATQPATQPVLTDLQPLFVTSTPTPTAGGAQPPPPVQLISQDSATPPRSGRIPPPAAAAPTTAPAIVLSATPLVDAKAKKDSGDLVGARDILNAALLAGHLGDADQDAARKELSDINQVLIFSPLKSVNDPLAQGYKVQPGEHLATIAARHDVSWDLLATINHIDPRHLRSGSTIKVVNGPFFAVVTKSKFRMDIYLGGPGGPGSTFITSYPVGLGKDDSTPTGLWHVMPGEKIRHPIYYSPRGGGVIAADDPKNPLGGYWIGLEGDQGQAVGKTSYGIHGTIDPDSIGKQESMGCIRLHADDIAMVYQLLVEGKSKILVRG
ncbi:MAG TPA: L,D-transpeptidase family protein [Tepidisphaeraceae bacterium]|nr:L,D-transpeptidase family protein [Tepidisphaeraceae bacterium]